MSVWCLRDACPSKWVAKYCIIHQQRDKSLRSYIWHCRVVPNVRFAGAEYKPRGSRGGAKCYPAGLTFGTPRY